MNKLTSIILITALSIISNYAMENSNTDLSSLDFGNIYVKYAMTLGQKHSSSQKEFYELLLPCNNTPEIRTAIVAIIKNENPPKNILSNEQILTSILKKNGISSAVIDQTLLQYNILLHNKYTKNQSPL
jgi:hypothetical protein